MTDDKAETWEKGYNGHEIAQMRRLARLSFQEKLAWLEEAHHFVLKMKKAHTATIVISDDACP